VKSSTHSAVCIIAALMVCGIARLLDVWVSGSTSDYGSAQYVDARFLWTVTLSRVVLAVPLGVLCWTALHRRPAFVVPILYLVCSVPLLMAFLVVPPSPSFDIFRNLAPYMGGHENLWASLVFVASVGVAALIRACVTSVDSNL
jgi:hypothetical protein